ncbi:MAG: hypothetical protein HQK51_20090 [Oligoflexia bacterium]|nr:hypothetical protein [Oligoflexia bacterium]
MIIFYILTQVHLKNYYQKLLGKNEFTIENIREFLSRDNNEEKLKNIRKALRSKDQKEIANILSNKENRLLFENCINPQAAELLKEITEGVSNLEEISKKIVEKLGL